MSIVEKYYKKYPNDTFENWAKYVYKNQKPAGGCHGLALTATFNAFDPHIYLNTPTHTCSLCKFVVHLKNLGLTSGDYSYLKAILDKFYVETAIRNNANLLCKEIIQDLTNV